VYDAATREWTLAAAMPLALGHIQPGTCLAGGKIVVAGGEENAPNHREVFSNTVFEYDPATDTWSRLANLPEPRISVFAGYVAGKLIVSSGNINHSPFVTAGTYLGY
jgi:N-acetylneuraminic acid mutarotase